MKLRDKKLIDFYVGGFFLIILKPIVFIVGKILRIDHSLNIKDKICFFKLLGGGSLVLAYPALLTMRLAYPNTKFIMITTPSIKPFVSTLNIFDEILLIKDDSIFKLFMSSLNVLIRIFRIDTFVDLEVYSRLSVIFSVFTCARNRIGFYLDFNFWRKDIFTYLIYFNRYAGVYIFYEQIAELYGLKIINDEKCKEYFLEHLNLESKKKEDIKKIGLGYYCSDLAKERMLSVEQWKFVFEENIDKNIKIKCFLFGGKNDAKFGNEIINICKNNFSNIEFINLAGRLNLQESVEKIYEMDEFWSIDSAMLHFARLMGIKTISFWGPTDPETLLKKYSFLKNEKIFYKKVYCSPCVHIVDEAPCKGNNICIENLFKNHRE
jgi:ADP-heptose:LPS heptosyltransferase